MRTSDSINEISAALAKAQGAMQNPEKDCTATIPMKAGGKYSYNYAGLPSIIDASRKALADNGLAHVAAIVKTEDREFLEMRLIHSSGQWFESTYELPILTDPKMRAAEITYGRRYLLTALIGVAADEDTDEKPEGQYGPKAPKQPAGPAPVKPKAPVEAQATPDFDQRPEGELAALAKALPPPFQVTKQMVDGLRTRCDHSGVGRGVVIEWLGDRKWNQITEAEWKQVNSMVDGVIEEQGRMK